MRLIRGFHARGLAVEGGARVTGHRDGASGGQGRVRQGNAGIAAIGGQAPRADAPAAGVRLRDVHLRQGQTQVFAGLSLDLSERRIAIIGRNGAGKSQLARLVAGLVAPDRGTVRVAGVDVARDRRAALATVGVLFQNPDHQIIFPTVGEELCFGLHQTGLSRAEAQAAMRAMLDRFGRAAWEGRAIHTLSQGQRHLVCLMAVLVMAPGLIVLDEPFAGLDLVTSLRLGALLETLPQALLHVTHDLDAVAGYARMIWLDGGQVVADGPPAEVSAAYRDRMRRLAGDAGGGRDAGPDL